MKRDAYNRVKIASVISALIERHARCLLSKWFAFHSRTRARDRDAIIFVRYTLITRKFNNYRSYGRARAAPSLVVGYYRTGERH